MKVLIHTIWMNFKITMARGRNQTTKSHMLYESTYMKYPEDRKAIDVKADWWLTGASEEGQMVSNCSVGVVFYFEVMKMFKLDRRWWLKDILNVLNTTNCSHKNGIFSSQNEKELKLSLFADDILYIESPTDSTRNC